MFLQLFLVFFAFNSVKVEGESLTPDWINTLKAAYSYSLDEDKKGDEYLKDAFAGKKQEKFNAAALEFFRAMCSDPSKGAVNKAFLTNPGKFIDALGKAFNGSNLPSDPWSRQFASVIGIHGIKKCKADAFGLFLESAYKGGKAPIKTAVTAWLEKNIRFVPDSKNLSGIVRLHQLFYNKIILLSAGKPFGADSETELKKFESDKTWADFFARPLPWRISALLPLSGKFAPLGRQVFYALLAAKKAWPLLEIIIHDTSSESSKTLKIYQEKVAVTDRSLVVIAPPDRESFKTLLAAVSKDIIVLYPGDSSGIDLDKVTSPLFFVSSEKSARVEVLLTSAWNEGARTFSIFYPDTNYGRDFAALFKSAVEKKGGKIDKYTKYTSSNLPSRPDPGSAQSVFIPDGVSNVETMARLLAAAGHFPGPLKKGKGMILLATAEAISEKAIDRSGRYFKNAYFAPVFSEAAPSVSEAPFVKAFKAMGMKYVLSMGIDTWSFLKNWAFILSGGGLSLNYFVNSVRSISAGPGLGNYYDNKGRVNHSRLYKCDGKTITLVTN